MLTKSKLFRPLALGAFALALVSAPFITSAKADWDKRGDRYERWVDKQEYRAKQHRRLHKAEKRHHHVHEAKRHHRHAHRAKHRRIRHAWKHHHDHHGHKAHKHHGHKKHHRHDHYGHKKQKKVVYKVVKVQQAPRYDHRERLIHSLIEAVLAANVAPRHR